MDKEKKSTSGIISTFMIVLAIIIIVRLAGLTLIENRKWSEYVEDVSTRQIYETAPRGDILDRNGEILAKSRLIYETTESDILGTFVLKEYERYYPNGSLAAHVLGYIGKMSKGEDFVGKTGIEKICEKKLKGQDAVTNIQVDSQGNPVKILNKTKMKKGKNISLTIDLKLQETTERALQRAIETSATGGVFSSEYGDVAMSYAPKTASAAAVVVEVKTGQVLAMASLPSFDPNDFVGGISDEKWDDLQQKNPNDPLSPAPLYNISTMTAVQPGSAFKPVTALAALECGLNKEMKLYDGGGINVNGRTFGCYLWNERHESHGYLNLNEAMASSCNYYFYDIATGFDYKSNKSLNYNTKITHNRISDMAKALGLGKKTGIEIDEASGVLPSSERKVEMTKSSLKSRLIDDCEVYFKRESIKNYDEFEKNIEKIVSWTDKDLTLEEIIGKLKKEDWIRTDKVKDLAELCKYSYFDQAGWSLADTFNLSIGQGDNAYTVLQMAEYMAALGNGGTYNNASLLKVNDKNNEANETGKSDKVQNVGKVNHNTVIKAMTEVVNNQNGSLYSLFSDFPFTVAAKTGTAQRAGKISEIDETEYIRRYIHLIAPQIRFKDVEEEAKRLMREYPDIFNDEKHAFRRALINLSEYKITYEDIDRYKQNYDNFAWTVALAPADNPQIAVAVMLVQGNTSSNAAPVAREIIGKYGEIARWEKFF